HVCARGVDRPGRRRVVRGDHDERGLGTLPGTHRGGGHARGRSSHLCTSAVQGTGGSRRHRQITRATCRSTRRHDDAVEVPEIRYARGVGNVDIAYSEFGRADGPLLVCVSGFISHLDLNWEAPPYANLIGPLAEACRVLAFDKRGTGLSGRDRGVGSLAERTDDIRAAMDACGWADAHLFGMSEGGPMAILFAATYPARGTSFALYGTGDRFRGV